METTKNQMEMENKKNKAKEDEEELEFIDLTVGRRSKRNRRRIRVPLELVKSKETIPATPIPRSASSREADRVAQRQRRLTRCSSTGSSRTTAQAERHRDAESARRAVMISETGSSRTPVQAEHHRDAESARRASMITETGSSMTPAQAERHRDAQSARRAVMISQTGSSRTPAQAERHRDAETARRASMITETGSSRTFAQVLQHCRSESERRSRVISETGSSRTPAQRRRAAEMRRMSRSTLVSSQDASDTPQRRHANAVYQQRRRLRVLGMHGVTRTPTEQAARTVSQQRPTRPTNIAICESGVLPHQGAYPPVNHIGVLGHRVCDACGARFFPGERISCCRAVNFRSPPYFSVPDREPVPPELQFLFRHQTAAQTSATASGAYTVYSRRINCALAFVSSETSDAGLTPISGAPFYRCRGALTHRIGPALVEDGPDSPAPAHAQFYFLDVEPAEQVVLQLTRARMRPNEMTDTVLEITNQLLLMIQREHPFYNSCMTAIELVRHQGLENLNELQFQFSSADGRISPFVGVVNVPNNRELGAIVPELRGPVSFVMHLRGETPQGQYLRTLRAGDPIIPPLAYPLLYWWGPLYYGPNQIPLNDGRGFVTQEQIVRYQLMIRDANPAGIIHHDLILHSGHLFAQWLCDMEIQIQASRMSYQESNQNIIQGRASAESIDLGDDYIQNQLPRHPNSSIPAPRVPLSTIRLSASLTGGPRYYKNKYLDSMAMYAEYGLPSLFITKTANMAWPEITANLRPGQSAYHRYDLVCRVFKRKLDALEAMIKKGCFGACQAMHAHIIVWLLNPPPVSSYDDYVSAEIPDPVTQPLLHELVKAHMLHTCDTCIRNGQCRFDFPKPFSSHTHVQDDNRHVTMKRRSPLNGGRTCSVGSVVYDNSRVAVYSPVLTTMFRCHLYVEFVTGIAAIKYLFLYIFKGEDRVAFSSMFANPFSEVPRERNEVTLYTEANYLVGMSACWKRLGFQVITSTVSVTLLRFYVGTLNYLADFMMDAFFELCAAEAMHPEGPFPGIPGPRAYDLRFTEVNRYYRFHSNYEWKRRVKRSPALSRLMQVDIRRFNGELYYLRMLFYHVIGPINEQAMRTYAGVVHPTYLAAATARGLVTDDLMWRTALFDGAQFQNPRALRQLLVTLLLHNDISEPAELWEDFRDQLCEDFTHIRASNQRPMIRPGVILAPNQEDWDNGLRDIQRLLQLAGTSNSHFNLPTPVALYDPVDEASRLFRRIAACLNEDPNSSENDLRRILVQREASLSEEQRHIYSLFKHNVENAIPGVHIVQAWAGSGKTFVANTLLLHFSLRSMRFVSGSNSGLSSHLMILGSTVWSLFGVPIPIIPSESVSRVRPGHRNFQTLQLSTFNVFDEFQSFSAPLVNLMSQTQSNIRQLQNHFGDCPTFFFGSLAQPSAITPNSNRAGIMANSITHSDMWRNATIHQLSENQRINQHRLRVQALVEDVGTTLEESMALQANLLLSENWSFFLRLIASGRYPRLSTQELESLNLDTTDPNLILLPLALTVDSLDRLVDFVYERFEERCHDQNYLASRLLMALRHSDVTALNMSLFRRVPDNSNSAHIAYSADLLSPEFDPSIFTMERLNMLNFPQIPKHMIHLKIGVIYMCTTNLQGQPGIKNGTRLLLSARHGFSLYMQVCSGERKDDFVIIPRINFTITPAQHNVLCSFTRAQFPLRMGMVIPVDKSNGQSVSKCGTYLSTQVFSHGQLNLAISRAGDPDGNRVFCEPIRGQQGSVPSRGARVVTRNLVYQELIANLPEFTTADPYDIHPYSAALQGIPDEIHSTRNQTILTRICSLCNLNVNSLDMPNYLVPCSCEPPLIAHYRCLNDWLNGNSGACPSCNNPLELATGVRALRLGPITTNAFQEDLPDNRDRQLHNISVQEVTFLPSRFDATSSWLFVPIIRQALGLDLDIVFPPQLLIPVNIWDFIVRIHGEDFTNRNIQQENLPWEGDYIRDTVQEFLLEPEELNGGSLLPLDHPVYVLIECMQPLFMDPDIPDQNLPQEILLATQHIDINIFE